MVVRFVGCLASPSGANVVIESRVRVGAVTFVCLGIITAFATGCRKPASHPAIPLKQRGYLWQRHWNPAVLAGAGEALGRLDGIVLLGAEIEWHEGHPVVIKANVPWEEFRDRKVSLGLRVAPFSGPFAEDNKTTRFIADTARSLANEVVSRGIELSEFQLDFDCAQKKLAGYRSWLVAVREMIAPVPLTITALPAWLGETDFLPLVRVVDGYVLQVHSVPVREKDERRTLCDRQSARRWVKQAAELAVPFSLALPTYRCLAGYAPDGKLLGVAMDSVALSWPPGTKVLEFTSDADELAELVAQLRERRPEGLKELIWYRVPMAADAYNWRWPTLAAVMQGRKPARKFEVIHSSSNPVDFTLLNSGESDVPLDIEVKVSWGGARATASDCLAGWDLKIDGDQAVFGVARRAVMRLPPGGHSDMGWIRYDQNPAIHSQIAFGKSSISR